MNFFILGMYLLINFADDVAYLSIGTSGLFLDDDEIVFFLSQMQLRSIDAIAYLEWRGLYLNLVPQVVVYQRLMDFSAAFHQKPLNAFSVQNFHDFGPGVSLYPFVVFFLLRGLFCENQRSLTAVENLGLGRKLFVAVEKDAKRLVFRWPMTYG